MGNSRKLRAHRDSNLRVSEWLPRPEDVSPIFHARKSPLLSNPLCPSHSGAQRTKALRSPFPLLFPCRPALLCGGLGAEEGKEERILGGAEGEEGLRSQEQSNKARAAWIDSASHISRLPAYMGRGRGGRSLLPESPGQASIIGAHSQGPEMRGGG